MGLYDSITAAGRGLIRRGGPTPGWIMRQPGSSSRAESLTDVLSGGSNMGGDRRTPSELMAAFHELPWLHAVVGKVASSVSMIPWTAYRPTSSSGRSLRQIKAYAARKEASKPGSRSKVLSKLVSSGDLEEVEDHPVLDLLYSGNPLLVGLSIRELTQAYLDINGEAFWLFEMNGLGQPQDIIPIPPDWVTSIATPANPFFRIEHGALRDDIPLTDMAYFKRPKLTDPFGRGQGTARALHDELATDEFAAKHTVKWFANSARPDILVYGEGLSKADTNRLEAKWRSKFSGFKNRFAPAFLSSNVEVKELNQSFQSMQLKELREFERDTIHQVFGVPPEVLGIIESSNRATIDAADFMFARWVLVPRMEFMLAVLDQTVLPMFADESLILDYESPIVEDKTHQLEVSKAHSWAFKVNEIREMAGFAPLDGDQGEVFMIPFNLVPSSSPALTPEVPEPPAPDPDPVPPDPVEPPDEPDPDEDEGRSVGGTNRLRELTGEAVEVRQEEEQSPIDDDDIEAIIAGIAAGGMTAAFDPVLRDIIRDFGQSALDDVEPDNGGLVLTSPAVLNYLREHAADQVTGITDVTRRQLRDALVEGVAAGEGIEPLRRRIQDVFGEASNRRARNIARTETVGASNFGSLEGYAQGGVPGKEWLTTQDGRQRSSHDDMDGQRRNLNDDFASPSGAKGPSPGLLGRPEEDCQCRCTVLPVLEGMERDGDMRAAIWRAVDRSRLPYERRLQAAAKNQFAVQRATCIRLLDERARAVA